MRWTRVQGGAGYEGTKDWPTIDAAAREFTAMTGLPVIFKISKDEPPEGSAEPLTTPLTRPSIPD